MERISATIRSPKEVIALACPDKADEVAAILVTALQMVPGTVIFVENGELIWAHGETK